MFSGDITKDGLSKSKVDPCGFCSFRVSANSVLCVLSGEQLHSRCAIMKTVTMMFSRNFASMKFSGNIRELVEHE